MQHDSKMVGENTVQYRQSSLGAKGVVFLADDSIVFV